MEYRFICDTCNEDYFGGTSLFTAKQRGFAHKPGHVWHIQAFNRSSEYATAECGHVVRIGGVGCDACAES